MVAAAISTSMHGKITPSLKCRPEVPGKAVLRAAAMLDINPPHLAQVLGVSASSISRLSHGTYSLKSTKKSWELAVLVVRLHQALESIMACDEVAMRSRMWNTNTDIHGTPAEHIATVQGLVDVVGYVESSRARV
jgi:hypothetical protein